MRKILLFDLDGTIIDSTPAILTGFDTAFKVHDKNFPDHEHLKSLIGHTLHDMFILLGAPKEQVQSYLDAYREAYHKIFLDQTTLLPNAKEAIELAYSFADLGVVTTKGSKFLPNLLDHLGVLRYFKTLVGLQDVSKPKPDPEPINVALERLNASHLDRNFSFMIGDTPLDAIAAKSAFITPLSVLCGYASEEKLLEHNDKIFNDTLAAIKFAAQV